MSREHDVLSANAWQRHQHYLRTFSLAHRGGSATQLASSKSYSTDADVVRAHHRFLWDEVQGGSSSGTADSAGDGAMDSRVGSVPGSDALTWEQQLAKRYWHRLFKEYVLADLSRYREGDIGLRWRTEQEVLNGRGQFSCGNKACNRRDVPLTSYELHFGYIEHGEAREALVKVRCCQTCAEKLNYRGNRDRDRAERKRARKEAKREKKHKRHVRECQIESAGSSGDDRGTCETGEAAGAGEEASGLLRRVSTAGNQTTSAGRHASSDRVRQPSEHYGAMRGRREEDDHLLDELFP